MGYLQTMAGSTAVLAICALLFIEESGVPMPFTPGDIVLVTAGSLASMHATDLWVIMPVAYASCILGALTCYGLSRRAGRTLVISVGGRIGITNDRLLNAECRLSRAGARAVFAARVVPGMRVYGSVASGCLRLDARTFIAGLMPAAAMWLTWCTLLGYFMGTRVAPMLRVWDRAMMAVTVVVVLTVAVRFTINRRRMRRESEQRQAVVATG